MCHRVQQGSSHFLLHFVFLSQASGVIPLLWCLTCFCLSYCWLYFEVLPIASPGNHVVGSSTCNFTRITTSNLPHMLFDLWSIYSTCLLCLALPLSVHEHQTLYKVNSSWQKHKMCSGPKETSRNAKDLRSKTQKIIKCMLNSVLFCLYFFALSTHNVTYNTLNRYCHVRYTDDDVQ
jgi:hypothetical protein